MASLFFNIFPASLSVVTLAFAFAMGAVFASFMGCVAARIQAGESPWTGRSHCDSCGQALGPLELVPVFSWIVAGGTCRHCGARIPVSCLVGEVLLGCVYVLIVLRFGFSFATLAYCALAAVLWGLSLVDLATMTIPNGFIVAGIVVWALYIAASACAAFGGLWILLYGNVIGAAPATAEVSIFGALLGEGWIALALDGLAGGLLLGGGMLVLSLVFDKVLGKESLGGGDVKLLFVVGLFTGIPLGLVVLMASCIIGLACAALMRARAAQFPFGPSIALATILCLLVGNTPLTWYLSLFGL